MFLLFNVLSCTLVYTGFDILRYFAFSALTEEWTFSTFIPLPKKGDLKQCANYRTIALVSHASKILLRIVLERSEDRNGNCR